MSNPSTLDQDRAPGSESPTANESTGSFGDILSQYEQSHSHKAEVGGKGLEGTVIAVSGESVFLDIGYKIEGTIPLAEFQAAGQTGKPGDQMPGSNKKSSPPRNAATARSRKARPCRARSAASPISEPSWTSAASTPCSTWPIFPGDASTNRPTC